MDPDVRQLRRTAARTAETLAARAAGATPPRGLGRLLRLLERTRQGLARKGTTLLREHWDLAAFDVVFGCLKAFGVYPALYFAGLAWTIPLMESALLNTQLWTGGYIFLRRKLRSELGRRRFGHALDDLDALSDRLLRVSPSDARHVHRFTLGDKARLLRVRRSRIRAWLGRVRGLREPGVVLQSELRAWVDPELRFLANPLRANPWFYEAVLLANLVGKPEAHERLLAASAPDEPATGEQRAFGATLGEAPMAVLARVTEQGDGLAATLRQRIGRASIARCLRWIHAAYARAVRLRLGELEALRYRVLADRIEGRALRESPHWGALCRKRAEVRASVARAGSFARSAGGLRSVGAARSLARESLGTARSRGLSVRRAHWAARLAGVEESGGPFSLAAGGMGA